MTSATGPAHRSARATGAARDTPGRSARCPATHGEVAACSRCGTFYCPCCAVSAPLDLCRRCLAAEGGAEVARLEGKAIGLAELGSDLALNPDRAIERLRRGRVTLTLWLGPVILPPLVLALVVPLATPASGHPNLSSPLSPDRMLVAGLALGPLLGIACAAIFAELAAALLRLLGGQVEARAARGVLLGSLLPSTVVLPAAAAIDRLLPSGASLPRALVGMLALGAAAWSFLFAALALAVAVRARGAGGGRRPLGPVRVVIGLGAALLATGVAVGVGAVLGGLLFR